MVSSPAASRPAPSRRETLLRVAADRIARSGYAGTSLRDVADAAGIQAGSIYHHFESKEMLAVELVRAFHADLATLSRDPAPLPADPVGALHDFAQQVAAVADRHRAAVYLCQYDAPSATGTELQAVVRRRPREYEERWSELLQAAARRGRLRPEVDLAQLQAILRDAVIDLGRMLGVRSSKAAVASLTGLLLHGLAPGAPPDATLDASPVTAVVEAVVAGWREESTTTTDAAPRRQRILDAAGAEFARRGYEATTVRDIADAAGLRASSMYRHFDSKQAMLSAIIGSFSRQLLGAYESVVESSGSATEALDGVMRLMCSATAYFPAEFVVIRDWWRAVADGDEGNDPALAENAARLRLLRTIVRRGVADGELTRPAHPTVLPLALRDVLWFPFQDLAGVTADDRFAFLRNSVLRGASKPATD